MQLVIVESPAKAKTIEKYLGSDYRVLASYGHVRDLPPKDGSVNPDDGFAMDWETYADKTKQLKAITDLAKTADRLILATDPDREGEAISWHVQEVLKKRRALPKEVERVTFNAITKPAILAAMKAPRELDTDLIDAYRARRALDYLVGFTLSPVLWRKLPGAKSAGRVQSVALRLLVQREREIETFIAQEYWSVVAKMEADGTPFDARLVKLKGKKLDKLSLGDAGSAEVAKAAVVDGRFTVINVETKPATRNPPPPFTTSTLQQEAARKLGFSASHTMRIAQSLYEDGAITYMRTDGVQMDGSAIDAARGAIAKRYDGSYVPDKPRQYQTKAKNAQEAHEAIRPTDFSKDRAGSGDHGRLYDLIWKRALASQMASARMERTAVELEDQTGQTGLRATGQVVLFPGYLALYEEGRDDAADEDSRRLPLLRSGDAPAKKDVVAEQHFTQPPPRFSEASLVKRLEELGIGRPSTYASIIQVLKDRGYVRVEKNRFFAEETGRLLTAFLERFFEKYVGYDFTAELEEELDDVSGGRAEWQAVLEAFWRDFKPRTSEVMEQQPSAITAELDIFLGSYLFPDKADGTDPRLCPNCGEGRLALRGGKFGAFIACSNYPECKYTRRFAQPGGEEGGDAGPEGLGKDPATGLEVERKSGRFGPYIQLGDGKDAKRASIPKDIGELNLEWALKLLSLPRTIGNHPETGEPIEAAIGRYGPYLKHAGKYARLQTTADVFETGMNAAVVKLAEAAAGGGRPARGAAKEPLKVLGAHPRTEAEIKLMEGRYGPYVTDGTTNATIPKSIEPQALTLEEAAQLIDDRAAAAPAKGKKKPAAKKAAPKKAAAKDGAVKKAPAKKAPAKKPAAKG
ncbi:MULTISPECIES: type I DNA topoisomerase [unclassified Sphingomonas]|uniref:type I DNA topoisomerase n=1 Tax=unclassified Sphingomonas TaxID=196159 RepID=UPI0006F9FC89|nr:MULTISPECIES: type I DNA topoisomerase [unclassified Sphingomonas]KQM57806.1 DNA topoisomerase I [Sphingomonas sp. Leaf16]KQN12907.1 DNA topoisomerase I [Sphingomonas sp. Leaf29]KQN19795.1 DNA topoisomerase I [Sphingomonas sp. Leaf32]